MVTDETLFLAALGLLSSTELAQIIIRLANNPYKDDPCMTEEETIDHD